MKFISRILLCLMTVVVFFGGVRTALADIMIIPTRIVFDDRERFSVVTLANNGDKTTTYEMGWMYFEMQETGTAYKEVEKSVTDFDLSKHVQFSPRRVTLAPGAKQKVRLALKRPADLPEGDYHAHLRFRALPDVISEKANEVGDNEAVVAVKINVGYTIPVILRNGEPRVDTEIERIRFERNPKNGLLKVFVPVTRTGSPFSVMGHLHVYHVDSSGNQTLVGEISNAHIFPEVDRREFEVHLTKEIGGGSLKVVMHRYDYQKGAANNFVYAQREFPLE